LVSSGYSSEQPADLAWGIFRIMYVNNGGRSMPDLFTNNEPVSKRIRSFMDRKKEEHPDIKNMNIKDITDYIEY